MNNDDLGLGSVPQNPQQQTVFSQSNPQQTDPAYAQGYVDPAYAQGYAPPPPQYAQASQPQYAQAPQPQYAPPAYPGSNPYGEYNSPRAHGIIWIRVFQVIAWVVFAAICMAGIALSFTLFDQDLAGPGMLVLVIAVAIAFFTVAGSMILLSTVENISKIRQALETMNSKMN